MTDCPVLRRLAAYRLDHDLTFQQLADQMRAAGHAVAARSLHLALTGRLRTQPRDRTLYKVQQFLETADGAPLLHDGGSLGSRENASVDVQPAQAEEEAALGARAPAAGGPARPV